MRRSLIICLLLSLCLSICFEAAAQDSPDVLVTPNSSSENSPAADPGLNVPLQELAAEFFAWRQVQQPASSDDIPRVERPPGWVPAFSPENIAIYRVKYHDFLDRLAALDRSAFNRADEVDALALAAAISRVGWELDVLNSPQRNPLFYVDQTLGSVFELLVLSSPVTPGRMHELVLRLQQFPATLSDAVRNLDEPVQPFARAAIDSLGDIEQKLLAMQAGLLPLVTAKQGDELTAAVAVATAALVDYRTWLQANLAGMSSEFAIGERAYQWFLVNVALVPNTPEELLAQGRQAWNVAVAWDAIESNRNRDLPPLPVFASSAEQIEASFRYEQEIRIFLENQGLMTVPSWLKHYRNRPRPDYLKPLAFVGVTDDLTSDTRLGEDAYSYIPEPAADLPFFDLAAAMDPRLLIAHEGVPGHYYQMALSATNPDPIRRRYIDSGANEGIGFYVEEMLLQAGLFTFSPQSRELVYQFMRLRALRVEVDIRLATGDFTIEEAGDYLARTVPMDRETAMIEATFFASSPGQGISYQVGKLQILRFLADARLDQGDSFSLRNFHDYLMANGNLPISLQRWEYLGRDDELQRLKALDDRPATVPD